MQTMSEVPSSALEDSFVPGRLRPWGDDGAPARIVAAQETMAERLRAIWASRELLVFLTRKEIKVRYQASVLGLLWSMLNPTVVLLTYFLVFTYFLKSAIPDFALFLFAGLLVWNLFSLGVQTSSTAVVGAAGIVKKVAFPREVLPLAQVGVAVFFFSLQLIVMALFLIGFRIQPTWSYIPLVVFGLIDVIVLTAGLALLVSGLTVFLRDMEHLIMVLMQAWFWLVPIVYSFADDLYYRFHGAKRIITYAYLADPVTPIILVFQRFFWGKLGLRGGVAAGKPTPSIEIHFTYGTYGVMLAAVLAGSVLIFWLGMYVFGRVSANFAEEL